MDSFIFSALLSSSLSTHFGKNHQLTWAADIGKLLAPTPNFNPLNGNGGIFPQASWREGVLGSFGDAPGGFKEEFYEIIWSTGFEYQFKEVFSLRTGYHYEHKYKGNRSDLTVGIGTKLGKVNIDASYLFRLNDVTSYFPVNNSLTTPIDQFRLTAGFSF